MMRKLTRRSLIKQGLAGLGALVLLGCARKTPGTARTGMAGSGMGGNAPAGGMGGGMAGAPRVLSGTMGSGAGSASASGLGLGAGSAALVRIGAADPAFAEGALGTAAAGVLGVSLTSGVTVPPFTVPLPLPVRLAPTPGQDAAGRPYDGYELSAEPGQQEIAPGLTTAIWGYDGRFPGPLIVARSGRPVRIKLTNNLPEAQALHLHGGHVPPDMAGRPADLIPPGATWEYVFANQQPAATLWYRSHSIYAAGPHVYRGLAGVYIVTDDLEDSLPLPRGEYDVPLLIQDRALRGDGSLVYTLGVPTLLRGVTGDLLLVNGAPQPRLEVARRKYRLRLLNGSNARFYDLSLSTGQPFVQVGADGGLLPKPVTRETVLLAPGERADVVVDFADLPQGTQVVLRSGWAAPGIADVMAFEVVRDAADDSAIPATLRPFTPLDPATVLRTRTFILGMGLLSLAKLGAKGTLDSSGMVNTTETSGSGMGMGMAAEGIGARQEGRPNPGYFTINGLAGDPARADAAPNLGDVEIWEFANPTPVALPVHIHGNRWQILDRNGAPPPEYEVGWKDTLVVPAYGRLRAIGRFTDYPADRDPMSGQGSYAFHCQILEHADYGMLGQYKVLPLPGAALPTPAPAMPARAPSGGTGM